jgi:chemotaxis methyl-accepting protein methylase
MGDGGFGPVVHPVEVDVHHVVPRLFEKNPSDRVRVWSVGCATGEEAYSLGMLLLERRLPAAALKDPAPSPT